MVTLLPPIERKPSFGQRLNVGIGKGLDTASQLYSEYQNQKMMQDQLAAENELGQKLGLDISGPIDPKMKQSLFLEKMKQQGKESQFQQKQDFLNQLFGSNKSEQNPSRKNSAQKGFNPIDISDEDIAKASVVDPNLGRSLQHAKDVALREQRENIRQQERETLHNRKEQIEFHKESQKYDEDLLKNAKTAKNQMVAINNIEKSIKSGKVKPFSLANIFKGFGSIGNKFSNAFLNDDQATMQASIPGLLEGWKEVFGVRLSDADLRLLQDKLPDMGKSKEANLAILKVMKKYGETANLRSQIASEVKKKNKGLRPLGYADQIEERFTEMTQPINVINPKTGNVIEIPAYKLSNAINAGARLANE